MSEILKTPEEWSVIFDVLILDPDGWRGKGDPAWDEPITREDFRTRMWMSTVGPRNFYK